MNDDNDSQINGSSTSRGCSSSEDNQGPLPARWERREDNLGRTYYVDHETRSNTWQRPSPDYSEVDTAPAGTRELPAGWEQRQTPEGRAYFVDHNTHTNTWVDPRRQQIGANNPAGSNSNTQQQPVPLLGPLPSGWEMRSGNMARVYFVDHDTKTTTWNDPRL